MIVAELKAGGSAFGEGAETLAHPLPDRLQSLKAISAAAGMKADALGRAVIDGNDCSVTVSAARVSSLQGSLALAGHDRRQVGAPHYVDPLGGDLAIMGARAPRPARALMRQQAMLAHEPQDAAAAGADAGEAQPRPQLAVALAVERAVLQELPDLRHQVLVRHRAKRSRSLAPHIVQVVAMAVDGRPRHAPDPRHPLQAINLVRGGRDLAAHRLDLRRAKGRAVSRRSILASSSSLAMVRSPTFSFRRPISSSRASAGRLFKHASPAARKASRQPLSSAAVTASSRETSSRSSPLSKRSTASCLRRADIRRRCPGVAPPPPACWARSNVPTSTPTSSSILHLLAVLYLQSGVSKNRRPGEAQGVKNRAHADSLVNALLRQQQAEELVQTVDRIRAVRAPEPKDIYLLTS